MHKNGCGQIDAAAGLALIEQQLNGITTIKADRRADGRIYTLDGRYVGTDSSTTAPTGFQSTFSAQRTVLTVVATVSGKKYYYPVVLDNATLERNKTYTVGLTITGLGAEDPNKPVEKGTISASITVSGWTAGAVYDETI